MKSITIALAALAIGAGSLKANDFWYQFQQQQAEFERQQQQQAEFERREAEWQAEFYRRHEEFERQREHREIIRRINDLEE